MDIFDTDRDIIMMLMWLIFIRRGYLSCNFSEVRSGCCEWTGGV